MSHGPYSRIFGSMGNNFRAATIVLVSYLLVSQLEETVYIVFSGSLPVAIELVVILPISLVLLYGPGVLWMIPVGYTFSALAGFHFGLNTIVVAVAHLYLGYSAEKINRNFGGISDVFANTTTRNALLRYVVLICLPASGAAAITAWGSEILHRTPFYISVVGAFVNFALVNLLFVGLLIAVMRHVNSRNSVDGMPETRSATVSFPFQRVAIITVLWVLIGAIGSLGYHVMMRVPAKAFERRGLDLIMVLRQPELVGSGAGRLQVILGSIMLVVLLVVITGNIDTKKEEL